jgi:hypothetical protein
MKPAKKKPAAKSKGIDTTPKIPVLGFSLRNKSDAAYRKRQDVLRSQGVKFSFRSNAKLTPQRKSAITRQIRKKTEFLNPKNNFQFVPIPTAKLRKLRQRGEIAAQQITSKGAYLPKPKKMRGKKTTFRVDNNGHVETKTGKFISTFKKFRSMDVVADPSIIQKYGEKIGAEKVFVSIKGHRADKSTKTGYSLKYFAQYFDLNVAEDIEDAQDNEDSPSAFRNWFAVEFISYKWGNVASTKGKSKNKNRRQK